VSGQRSPREELALFLDQALPAHQREWGADASMPARIAWQRRLAEGGWVGLHWAVEHGGRGLSIVERIACDSELARRDAPLLAGLLGINNVGPTLIAAGSPEQRQHLPSILDAREIWCQGFSEPDAGSDLASLRTTARVVEDGFVVNGRKVWTTNGMEATHCMLLARTGTPESRHRGISALVFPMDVPGLERRPIQQMDGGAEFAEMSFDDVRLPASALLGPLNEGWRVAMTTLAHERVGVISQAAGLERRVFDEVLAVASAGQDPVLRDKLAQRLVEGRVLGMLGEQALAELTAGVAPGPRHSLIRLAQGLLRQQLAETLAGARGAAVAAGGAPDAARELLASRSVSIAAGTREILKTLVAEQVLGLPRV
jgi:alkylation response protein AidB-like acyl-CoA dehydrogenase